MPHEEISQRASYDEGNPHPLQIFAAEHFHDTVGMCTVHFTDANFLGPLLCREGNQAKNSHQGYDDGKHCEEQQHLALLLLFGVVLV